MKKKLLLASLLSIVGIGGATTFAISPLLNNAASPLGEKTMNKAASRIEFDNYVNNLKNFPCSFMYGTTGYHGFRSDKFTVTNHEIVREGAKEQHLITMKMIGGLTVTLDTSYYEGYDAFDWTIRFINETSADSAVISNWNAADLNIKGRNALIKGILGDHDNQYAAYDKDLTKADFVDENTIGRSTHITFPYYDLENDEGGAMLAIGWPGTYRARFSYNEETESTNFVGQGCLDLCTYLKPGETIMSPLIGVVRYYEKNEYTAINAWRRWYVDCNAPDVDGKGTKFSPIQGVFFKRDIKAGPTNDADSETSETWKRSYDKVIEEGIDYDFRLIDAGWYVCPDGSSTTTDWWSYVGTWTVDKAKWPGNSFKETCDYSYDRGKFTQLWFESERVTHLNDMISLWDFKREWGLSDHGDNETNLVNLGNEEAYTWLKKRIVKMITTYKIGLYREDFNTEPGMAFEANDVFYGPNRRGITENLYTQGHFSLWEEVIAAQLSVGGCNYIDDCASGGGRNDLLSMRYSYPFNRSDADWAMVAPHSIPLRLAFSHSTYKWLPIGGVYVNEMADGKCGMYNLRASYAPIMTYACQFTYNKQLDWDNIKRAQSEWKQINKYLYKDYYPLTPYHKVSDDKSWDVFQFMDKDTGEGIIQAFRKERNTDRTATVQVQGLEENTYYSLIDTDGNNTLSRVRGGALMKGYTIVLDTPASAAVILIKKA